VELVRRYKEINRLAWFTMIDAVSSLIPGPLLRTITVVVVLENIHVTPLLQQFLEQDWGGMERALSGFDPSTEIILVFEDSNMLKRTTDWP